MRERETHGDWMETVCFQAHIPKNRLPSISSYSAAVVFLKKAKRWIQRMNIDMHTIPSSH